MAVLAIAPANAPAIRDDVTLSYEVNGFELDCSDRNLKIREKKITPERGKNRIPLWSLIFILQGWPVLFDSVLFCLLFS